MEEELLQEETNEIKCPHCGSKEITLGVEHGYYRVYDRCNICKTEFNDRIDTARLMKYREEHAEEIAEEEARQAVIDAQIEARQNEPEPDVDIANMMVDHEFRLTMLELGL